MSERERERRERRERRRDRESISIISCFFTVLVRSRTVSNGVEGYK